METLLVEITTPGADIASAVTDALDVVPQHSTANLDTLIISLGAGTYNLQSNLRIHCNLVIKGSGKTTTVIECSPTATFIDDGFVIVYGTYNKKLQASISDVSFKLGNHQGIIWTEEGEEKLLLKFNHVNSLFLNNIACECRDAFITCVDLRWCSNIIITGCDFANYNNCQGGGVIWVRGDTRNVLITRNKIVKNAHDEIFAFWCGGDGNTSAQAVTSGIKENIIICNNDILYTSATSSSNLICGSLMTCYNKADPSDPQNAAIEFRNIQVCNNNFLVNAPLHGIVSFTFENTDTHSGILISGNHITFTNDSSATNSGLAVFGVHDSSESVNFIEISSNEISYNATVTNSYGYSAAEILHLTGGSVLMRCNRFVGKVKEITVDNTTRKVGMSILRSLNTNKLVLEHNHFLGIFHIADLGDYATTDVTEIIANNNIFSGDTRIYFPSINRCDLKFTENIFISESYEMFLQEFASVGTLVFNNNRVNILFTNVQGQHVGVLFAHYTSEPLSSMYFERFEVTNNDVTGTTMSTWIMSGLNCGLYIVNNNTFSNP